MVLEAVLEAARQKRNVVPYLNRSHLIIGCCFHFYGIINAPGNPDICLRPYDHIGMFWTILTVKLPYPGYIRPNDYVAICSEYME